MGINYTQDQERIADKCAVELMENIGVNPIALSSALHKIKNYCILNGNYFALSGEGTHPSLNDRIMEIGEPIEFYDKDYDKRISFVNTFNAIIELNNQHFESCYNLGERNVIATVATEDDYILMAMTTLKMYNSEIKNKQALELITKAKTLNIYPTINIPKQEAIALIRLKRNEEAEKCLEEYRDKLKEESMRIEMSKGLSEWRYINNHIDNEYEWTVKMINKVRKF